MAHQAMFVSIHPACHFAFFGTMNYCTHTQRTSQPSHRAARSLKRGASSLSVLIIISLLALTALFVSLFALTHRSPGVGDLSIYCAAGMRYPMVQVVEQYEAEYDVTVRVQYGGSNTLFSSLQVSGSGDLFLAADASYVDMARAKGLAAERLPLATMCPVIVVSKKNETGIQSVDDLLQPGLRLALGNPDAAAIGKKTKQLLEASGHWSSLDEQVNQNGVYKPTVNEVANDVKLGSVDAGIVWDTTAAQYDELQAIHVPELDKGTVQVEICVLNSTQNPTAALHFARYVAARDRGLQTFADESYNVVEGDVWQDVPELTFFAGSVNRRALEPVLQAFEKREGVRINTVYNGCGILTGQMRIIEKKQDETFPDTYMACDVYYLETVKDLFQEAVNVSDTDIVIAVEKGNPKQIKTIRDLLKPDVRVVIGQPEQCTIGVLTRRLLEHEGVYEELLENNVVAQKETSAALVPSITTKSADATFAYRTDTLAERDKVDVIALDSELSKAIQPFSIAKSSKQKYLGRRLFESITQSRDAFESVGFHWRLEDLSNEDDLKSRAAPSVDQPDAP
jgi:molybdenum ABC transporter molybdate-binding protein